MKVPYGHPRWHDDCFHDPKPYTCKHCGAKGEAHEADPTCEECGNKNYLPIEVPKGAEPTMKTVEPGQPRWHDKSFAYGKPFTCKHCGSRSHAAKADAQCDGCGKNTRLPIEVPEEEVS